MSRHLTPPELLAAIRESAPETRRQIASEWLAAFIFITAMLALSFVLAMMQ